MTKQLVRSPKKFTSISDALAAVGETREVDFMATIDGQKDKESHHIYAATELEYTLEERGFSSERGDSVQVWLPQEIDADMLDAS
jgi:hypothetical protein